MQFTLFLLLNAVLLIRPAEVVPALESLPIYNALILACLAVSCFKILDRLSYRTLIENPIDMCVLGIFVAVPLSHLSHLKLEPAREGTIEFAKILIYYFLFVSVIDTPARIRRFLWLLTGSTVVLTMLALLQYHGAIDLPALRPINDGEIDASTGASYTVLRLCGTGIYHDPNDLCLILLISMSICLFGMSDQRQGLTRFCWLAPFFLFGYALTKTHSKGGFIAMVSALVVLFIGRYGWRKATPLIVMILPVIFVIFAGRQTQISTSNDTGQDRIRLWSSGLNLFRQSPLFGIGQNRYADEAGLVAHNSFLHGFTELGMFGGLLFTGAFYYAAGTLHALAKWDVRIPDPELRRLRPYLLAMVVSYSVCLLTLSRNYIVPTYMLLGLVSVYLRIGTQNSALRPFPMGPRLATHFILCSVAFLAVTYVFVRLFARFGI